MAKYKAQPVYLDFANNQLLLPQEVKRLHCSVKKQLIYFASQHELVVYHQLKTLPTNYAIQFQPKVEVIPPNKITCHPKGKSWKADFMVFERGEPVMLIEAKGKITYDFLSNLVLLELNNQELFTKLWLVFPQKIPNNQVINRLLKTPMKERILTLKDFKRKIAMMNTLPLC